MKIFHKEKIDDKRIYTILGLKICRTKGMSKKDLFYKEKLEKLKQIVDIRKLKPATGLLREHQMKLLKFTQSFFEEIKDLNVKPFLVGGNILGAVRHGGYIPWDDDFDFGLMRDDYENLIDYCKKRFKFFEYDINLSTYRNDRFEVGKRQEKALQAYPNEYVCVIMPGVFQVLKGTSITDFNFVDFFSYDCFDNDYKFEDHRKYLDKFDEKCLEINYWPEVIKYMDEQNKTNPYIKKHSNNMYFGVENLSAQRQRFISWLNMNNVLPLSKIEFEGIEFWAPHNPIKYLEYEIPNYMEYPPDLGYSHHLEPVQSYIDKGKKNIFVVWKDSLVKRFTVKKSKYEDQIDYLYNAINRDLFDENELKLIDGIISSK